MISEGPTGRLRRRTLLTGLATAAASVLAPPEALANLLDAIKQRGEIVVGTEAAFEPFEFVRDGKIVGYNKDILDYVVAGLAVRLDQLNLPFQGLLPGLLAKKFDFIATSVAINQERAKRFAYTRPIGTSDNAVVVRANDDRIKSAADLNGKIVATQLASSVQPVLESYDATLKSNGGTGLAAVKLFQTFPDTEVALANSQVDAAILASAIAAVLMKKVPGVYKVVGSIGEPIYLAWVTRPDDLDLRDYINRRIDQLDDSGKLKQWQMQWFGFTMATPKQGYLPPGAF